MVRYTPLKFNNTYEYPWWGYTIGGVLSLSTPVTVLLRMLYAVSVTPGTLRQVTDFVKKKNPEKNGCCILVEEEKAYEAKNGLLMYFRAQEEQS